VVVDNLITGKAENLPKEIPLIKMSIQDSELDRLFHDFRPDIVNHHAAQIDVRKSVASPTNDAQINILGSLNLFEACRKYGVKKVILASTGGAIYGKQQDYPATEFHPTEPESPYGIAKLAAEKYLQFYSWTYELSFVALRYSNIYGPRQNSLTEAGVIAIFIEKLLRGEVPTIFGNGKQTRDYVFVNDVVDCNVQAIDSGINGVFNVGTGIETDVNTLSSILTELIGVVDIKPNHAPSRAGEQLRSCLNPGRLQKSPPTTLLDGLEKTVEWFRHHSNLAKNSH
jgi:UDP-glucose 4-epimerase